LTEDFLLVVRVIDDEVIILERLLVFI